MRHLYLDTSALIKRYRSEPDSFVIDALFDRRLPTDRLVTSQFTTVEVAAVAARGLRGKRLDRESYATMLAALMVDLRDSVDIEPVTADTVRAAAGIALQYGLRAPDAVQLATARTIRSQGGAELIFVSGDRELLDIAVTDGFDVLDPRAADIAAVLRALRIVANL